MKDQIDAIYKEITGKDVSQTSALSHLPHPSGQGHTYRYMIVNGMSSDGFAFDTADEFRAIITPKKEDKAMKKVVKKVAKKVSKKKK